MTQPIHLYFGVRDEPDLYLESHFAELARAHRNLRFVPVLSKASKAQARRTGLLAEALAADFPALAGFKAYVFGPSAMVHATIRALRALGIEPGDIHTDEPP
jgi:CDP-4-dehydro-6-deoxyglucose reductase/ferredoxin-NAD(P)+ reductase (naphthalene dioxygenase ferredoxin-specific)